MDFLRRGNLGTTYSSFRRVRRNKLFSREISDEEYHMILDEQGKTPTIVMTLPERRRIWWAFSVEFYYHSDDERDPEVVKGLILQKIKRDQRRRQRAIDTARQENASE